ncbi:MAG: elongation factor Ts [Actinomycetota bacterium]|jgi:elongation factor Ts|nr:elongation factor Ts [Actinomycetota bacterium]
MAEISAKDVAALRKQTGAGMMDCKAALTENDGDFDRAKDWLREKGMAGASKRAGRSADQGAIDVALDRDVDGKSVAALVELNCETDFVAKSADYKALVAQLAELVLREGDENLADAKLASGEGAGTTVADTLTQLSSRIGEKVELGRIARFETADGVLDAYKHVQSERGVIGVLVELGGVDPTDAKAREVAHDLVLHIASAAPRYVNRDDVPADDVERERAILEAQTREEGKPEPAIGKIVDGKLGGFFKSIVLAEQPFVRDPKTTIGALVATLGTDASVRRFSRVKIGEE